MSHVYVAIGSNIDPEENIAKAARELQHLFPDARFSSWYRNRAVGFDGDDFVNGVVGFTTDLPLSSVIEKLHAVEGHCGRPRNAPRWAPRAMDLDVLLYDDVVCAEPTMTLPRPDLLKRPYMLGPLAEIAPEVVHPTAGLSIGELWQRFDRDAHAMTRIDSAELTNHQRSDRRPPPESDL
ncbi:MAG: 2-amino-4-hydroxy-6-hydroxymethyldihydropteridine diphosphokinase [Steroidobacteraceae bacterium]